MIEKIITYIKVIWHYITCRWRSFITGMYVIDNLKNRSTLEYYVNVAKDNSYEPKSAYEVQAEEYIRRSYEAGKDNPNNEGKSYEDVRSYIASQYALAMMSLHWRKA